jgi:alpha-amylase/alpha-mannosidase (GH57 family)
MNHKYICIHGHFYQPPRENAWLEVVEQQESAAPYHDWNDRINFECYAANTAARVLGEKDRIINIINNYERISFNFGPTLLHWLEKADPAAYKSILEADIVSQLRFDGHGSAMAQVYGHLILPLANQRDRVTQVRWGIRDFEHRFKRKPAGMWLSETAANTDTLEVLAAEGILFTVLAPRQAKAFRRLGDAKWIEVSHENIDTRRPYTCLLPSGNRIDLFFYDGDISQAVAFKGLLMSGKLFAKRLELPFTDDDEPELVHIATDGETFGHHHRFGEMALADCLQTIEKDGKIKLTNYAQYLAKFPPQFEAKIHENSSWSCVHGVQRWTDNCGCNSGGNPSYHQKWRGPLRFALNWLRDQLIPVFETEGNKLLKDPWVARDQYIDVLLDRSDETIDAFLRQHALKPLNEKDRIKVLRLMEMQRNTMLMYTSCGWFFDEVSGIETIQIMQYACRAIAYNKQITGANLEEEFRFRLKQVPSNVAAYQNAGNVYDKKVVTAQVSLEHVGMHIALSSLFEKYPPQVDIYNYLATSEVFERLVSGYRVLTIGKMAVKSRLVHSEQRLTYAVLYLGQLDIIGNISVDMDSDLFEEVHAKLRDAFKGGDLPSLIGLLQQYFGANKYSIWQLFRDERQKVINIITDKNTRLLENSFEAMFQEQYPLMSAIHHNGLIVPDAYRNTIQFAMQMRLHEFFKLEKLNIHDLQHILDELTKWDITITDKKTFRYAASERIYKELQGLRDDSLTAEGLKILIHIFKCLDQMEIGLDLWKSQNLYFSTLQYFLKEEKFYLGEEWKTLFFELGEWLEVKVEG